MRVVNAVIKEKLQAFEVEAERYTNLPKASDRSYGVMKIDNDTIKINSQGQAYVDGGTGSGGASEEVLEEHILDENKHLNNLRRRNLDEMLPAHLNNNNIHLTTQEKIDLIEALEKINEHILKFHLSEDDFNVIKKNLTDLATAIETHADNQNLHPSKQILDNLSNVVNELNKKLKELESDYISFKPTVSEELQSLNEDKLNNKGLPSNKIVCTGGDGSITFKDINITDLEVLENLYEIIENINNRIDSVRNEKADFKRAEDHYKDMTVHTNKQEKESILVRISALEEYNQVHGGGGGLELTKDPTDGNIPFYGSSNSKLATPAFVLVKGSFVENVEELEEAKKTTVNFEDVFNKWNRFSHNTTENQPANADETKAWRYDAATKKVICTINSATHIGFISREKYDTYVHECTLKSSSSDNDMIGVVIAFAKDSNGREHTLTLVRNASIEGHVQVPGASSFQWGIVYNFGRSDAKLIASKPINGDVNTPWSSIPNGIRVRIERKNNSIKAYTSKMNESSLLDSSILEADLSTSQLKIFSGEKSYGYSCLSQDASTFEDIKFVGGNLDGIYDMTNGDKWVNVNDTWIKDYVGATREDIGFGKFLYNELTGKLFFIKDEENIIRINLSQPTASSMSYSKKYGPTSEIPRDPYLYQEYVNTDTKKTIWWDGENWIDAMGNIV